MKIRGIKAGLALLSLLYLAPSALAKENRWTHFGTRPLAMGNAYVSIADDFNALFYNPAGLARIKEWDFEVLNPTLSVGADTIDTISEIMDLGSSTADVLDFFEDKTGKNQHFSLSLTPHFIMQNFGFGIGINAGTDIAFHSDIDVEATVGANLIVPITYAMNFLGDRLSVGGSIKLRGFAGLDGNLNIETLSELGGSKQDTATEESDNENVRGGSGAGVDIGILFTPIQTMKPTLGLSITDLGGTTFKATSDEVAAPEDVLPSVNAGFSLRPIDTKFSYLSLALETHSINQPIHYSHKLRFGAEWGISSILKLQAGLADGYLTGGLEFDVALLNLRFASYAVDHGPIVGLNEGLVDRRYALQIKLII